MPAQTIVRLSELNLVLDPGADDVMSDRHGRPRAQTRRMPAQQHARDLVAIEPAGILEFGAIDDDVMGERFGVATDHQRARKWPRLRSEITYPPSDDAGFFAGLAPYCFLDRLPRLHESGKTRPHAGNKAVRAPKHATVARKREHDDDRIGPRKVLRVARWTVAPPPSVDRHAGCSAVWAITVASMPAEQRLGLCQGLKMLGCNEPIHRDRA